MPRIFCKRKTATEDSSDEALPARPIKAQRTSRNTVNFAETGQAVSFDKYQKPKSILKTRSVPFTTAPASPEIAKSPSPERSSQSEEEERFDTEEVDEMRTLATAALQLAEKAYKKRLEQDVAAAQKELASTKDDLEAVRGHQENLLQVKDKAVGALGDANKRTETACAEAKEALLANGKLESKVRSIEDQLARVNGEVEELRRELTVVREEKARTERLLEEQTAKSTAEVGS